MWHKTHNQLGNQQPISPLPTPTFFFFSVYKVFVILLQINCTLLCERLCIFTGHTADKHVLWVRIVGRGTENCDQCGRKDLNGLLPYTWVALWIYLVSVQSTAPATQPDRLCCLTKQKRDRKFWLHVGFDFVGTADGTDVLLSPCLICPTPHLDKWASSRGLGFR